VFVLVFCSCEAGKNTASDAEVSGALSNTATAATPAANEPVTSESYAGPSDSPESTAVPFFAHTPYQPGDKGDDIRLLQNMLIDLGFDPGDADGIFGTQLKKAVRNFQLYAGLDADGIADQYTVDALETRYNDSVIVIDQSEQPLKDVVIGLDPGHQRTGNSRLEPGRPDSDNMKKKVSTGTAGRFTGVPEYVVTLQVSLKLKQALESLGARVVMTREKHDVDISNAERAKLMNSAKVDCWLRIHANGSDNPDIHGMFMLVPAKDSMATDDPAVQEQSVALAETLLKAALSSAGAESLGVVPRSDQTGFGWSQVPVCTFEMGHMTNKEEDFQLVSEIYQNKIVQGLAEGFVAYFQ
jgi:N-acetylmuramoyl-L-alanine amidase